MTMASFASSLLAVAVWLAPAEVWIDRSRMLTRLLSTERATCACSSEAVAIRKLRSLISVIEREIASSAAPASWAILRVLWASVQLCPMASTACSAPVWISAIMLSISLVDS
ncbi:hypothetical protein D9M73_239720 [compost metagenome]